MRPHNKLRPRPIRWTAAMLLAGLTLGCESTPKAADEGDAAETAAQPQPPADPAMQAILSRMDEIEQDNRALRQELISRDRAEVEARRLLQQQRTAETETANPVAPVTQDPDTTPATQPQANPPAGRAGLASFSDDQLLEALLDRIAEGGDEPHVRALKTAAMSMLTRRHELDYALLEPLDPATREQVVRFHQLVAITFEEIAAGQAHRLSRRDMFEKVEEVFGNPPLQFGAIELCRRVDGYGIFSALPSHRFVAGRLNTRNGGTTHDAVLYMELENFVRQQQPDGTYEVSVSWELELYDSTGDVPVWRQPAAVVTDNSRNRRRDFFLAQTIDLPPNLTAGGYLLKIRVIDRHSGSRAERTLSDIQIVADRDLVEQ